MNQYHCVTWSGGGGDEVGGDMMGGGGRDEVGGDMMGEG